MNPELILKFMAQDRPWAFGLRAAIPRAPNDDQAPSAEEVPFFASVGNAENRFTVVGDDLAECLDVCLQAVPAVPARAEVQFVTLPPKG